MGLQSRGPGKEKGRRQESEREDGHPLGSNL